MGKQFRVLKIDELSRPSEFGGIDKYYRHTIKTGGGVVLTVDIPEAEFSEEKVKPILEAKAAEADRILSL